MHIFFRYVCIEDILSSAKMIPKVIGVALRWTGEVLSFGGVTSGNEGWNVSNATRGKAGAKLYQHKEREKERGEFTDLYCYYLA